MSMVPLDPRLLDSVAWTPVVIPPVFEEALVEAIDELTPIERDVINLLYWERLSYTQAAEALGVTAQTIWRVLTRAKSKLATLLGEEEL